MTHCRTCHRTLNDPSDPFSADHGGDCSVCQIEHEIHVGDFEVAHGIALGVAINIMKIFARDK